MKGIFRFSLFLFSFLILFNLALAQNPQAKPVLPSINQQVQPVKFDPFNNYDRAAMKALVEKMVDSQEKNNWNPRTNFDTHDFLGIDLDKEEYGARGLARIFDKGGEVWSPPAGLNWAIYLQGPYKFHPADVIELDYESGPFDDANSNKNKYILTCYISVGSWEKWRGDAKLFCEDVLGEPLPGWPDEKVLKVGLMDYDCDKTATSDGPKKSILELMIARFQTCTEQGATEEDPEGAVGTEFDNTDTYTYSPNVTKPEMQAYLHALIPEAHKAGLAVGFKNTPELIPEFEPLTEYAVNEECWEQGWCDIYKETYLANDKPVFGIEYADPLKHCAEANLNKFSVLWKTLKLDGTEHLDCQSTQFGFN